MSDITLQQIAAFIKVAECLSFTRAAEAMYITQPALSRIVSRFEKAVNTALFIRRSHSVELTEKGMRLYSELLPIYKNMVKALRDIGDTGENRTLRIACHTSFDLNEPDNAFRTAIREYRQKNPGVAVTIHLYELTELRDALLRGGIDIIYSVKNTFEDLSVLRYKVIEDIPMYIAMSMEHPLARADSLTPDKLSEEDFYFISSPNADSPLVLCRQFGLSPKRIISLHNYPSVIMAVRQGKGMTLCGIDVKYTYGADIKFFEIPAPYGRTQMILAWSPDNSSAELSEFVMMIP